MKYDRAAALARLRSDPAWSAKQREGARRNMTALNRDPVFQAKRDAALRWPLGAPLPPLTADERRTYHKLRKLGYSRPVALWEATTMQVRRAA